jgi:putative ubiquitin-RnfH superfamily antitoxin RatB of RatAB toxin-antitoxin module
MGLTSISREKSVKTKITEYRRSESNPNKLTDPKEFKRKRANK